MRSYLGIAAVVIAGCSGEPSCKDVVDHVAKIGDEQLAGGKERDKAIAECEQMKLSAETKKCLMKASTPEDLSACIPEPDEVADYKKQARTSEAKVQLKKIEMNAKVAHVTNAEFPKGKAALTPEKPCCESQNAKCSPRPDAWMKQAVWKDLDFQIDEPHRFQYSYESDGKTLTARAVGDLDCDDVKVTYELKGEIVNGNAQFTHTDPPPNSD